MTIFDDLGALDGPVAGPSADMLDATVLAPDSVGSAGFISTQPNVFGGMNVTGHGGQVLGHTEPNVFGGQNAYDAHGSATGHSMPNVFGGVDWIP